MATTTLDAFFDSLEASRLVAVAQTRQIREQIASRQEEVPPAAVARWLVDRGVVTQWQADELLAGRNRFFLQKYKLLEKVGSGASGTVYKAVQTQLGRIVAIKVLTEELSRKPEALARFKQETRMAASVHHPNIITAYDAESDEDVHFLVMEYMEGRDLNRWIKEAHGLLPIHWACEVIRQAALGLQHAHEQGLIHRDIKPGNLLIRAESFELRPEAKVLDLGFARKADDDGGVRLTRSWQIFGTPDYMSPEQAESTFDADIRSDIFSLGCTLFKALTGQLPFAGGTPVQKLLARANRDAPKVCSLRSEIPATLEAVVAKMLARKPEQRYQTPGEVAFALAPFSMIGESGDESFDRSFRSSQSSINLTSGGFSSARGSEGTVSPASQANEPTRGPNLGPKEEDLQDSPTMADLSLNAEDGELVDARPAISVQQSDNRHEQHLQSSVGSSQSEATRIPSVRPDLIRARTSQAEEHPATAPAGTKPGGQFAPIHLALLQGMVLGGGMGLLFGLALGSLVGFMMAQVGSQDLTVGIAIGSGLFFSSVSAAYLGAVKAIRQLLDQ